MGEAEVLKQVSIQLAETLVLMKSKNMTVNPVYRGIERVLANCNLIISSLDTKEESS